MLQIAENAITKRCPPERKLGGPVNEMISGEEKRSSTALDISSNPLHRNPTRENISPSRRPYIGRGARAPRLASPPGSWEGDQTRTSRRHLDRVLLAQAQPG